LLEGKNEGSKLPQRVVLVFLKRECFQKHAAFSSLLISARFEKYGSADLLKFWWYSTVIRKYIYFNFVDTGTVYKNLRRPVKLHCTGK
jgi:hypothetical protein